MIQFSMFQNFLTLVFIQWLFFQAILPNRIYGVMYDICCGYL